MEIKPEKPSEDTENYLVCFKCNGRKLNKKE
jgi:hypothetical protein